MVIFICIKLKTSFYERRKIRSIRYFYKISWKEFEMLGWLFIYHLMMTFMHTVCSSSTGSYTQINVHPGIWNYKRK